MKSKLIKSTVRKSGNVIYVGRIRLVRNYQTSLANVIEITGSNGLCPAQIATAQRYMKISSLGVRHA